MGGEREGGGGRGGERRGREGGGGSGLIREVKSYKELWYSPQWDGR